MVIIEKIRHRYDPYIGDAQPIVADLTVSTAAELPALGAKIGTLYAAAAGTRADVIHTGMRYTLDADGKWYTSDAYETKSVSGGEITFTGNGTPLIDYTIRGNCVQDGTPTLAEPVWLKQFGASAGSTYGHPMSAEITIACNGISRTIALPKPLRAAAGIADEINFASQAVTRKIAQASFIGAADEFNNWTNYIQAYAYSSSFSGPFFVFTLPRSTNAGTPLCSHYVCENIDRAATGDGDMTFSCSASSWPRDPGFTVKKSNVRSASGAAEFWKALFAEQKEIDHLYPRGGSAFAQGKMPVTVWYPLAPEYWTTEHIELPEITTVHGENTVTVTGGDFDISPSGIDIAYR